MYQTIPLSTPQLPGYCPAINTDAMSLRQNRDYMNNLAPDIAVRDAVLILMERWRNRPDAVQPLAAIRDMLDAMRKLPRSEARLTAMNTLLRTLGQPEIFATLLHILCQAAHRTGTSEEALSEVSRQSSKHAVYGWCGQTRLALSGGIPTQHTLMAAPGVQAFLGKTPTAAWSLSMHIWQPNPCAEGFVCGHRSLPGIIAEPPHSHPFDFASVVVIGQMHQSVYAPQDHPLAAGMNSDNSSKGRYDGIPLEHVHGVWPPHEGREKSYVTTLEDRVPLNAGDSYYMAADTIHDVQIDAAVAQRQPAITLFLRSESFVRPHVYMATSMADFHDVHPALKHQGYPLEKKDWLQKLERVADYVKGKTTTLTLADIVQYDNEYAFFHR